MTSESEPIKYILKITIEKNDIHDIIKHSSKLIDIYIKITI